MARSQRSESGWPRQSGGLRTFGAVRSQVVVALGCELSAVVDLLGDVDDEGFELATNCPPWTLKELVVHINGTTRLPPEWQAGTGPPRPAADYYRRPERSTSEYRQQNVLESNAPRLSTAQELTWSASFRPRTMRSSHVSTARTLQRVVEAPNLGAMTIESFAATRVLGVAAHAIDVAITLDVPREPCDAALTVCTPILVDLLGAEPPSALAWSASDFFQRATGRVPLDNSDIAHLGPLADQFPLIS